MSLSHILSNCSAQAIAFPTIFGAEFLSDYRLYRDEDFGKNMSFCNVTLTHTHPKQNDTATSMVWLPLQPDWNGRLKMVGGGGWTAGLDWFTDITMSVAVADGYAAVTTDGGVSPEGPEEWALLSPGNLNMLALQNFAHVTLKDAALTAKSVIKSFFGRPAKFSYFDGCSQGGRQGLMFAQRYPDIFNGIHAAAPAIYTEFLVAAHFPQQVMNEMREYPHPCELDALTNAAIEYCDGFDGLLDGIISDEDACYFDPYTAIGRDVDCSSPFAPDTITETAAIVADAAWNGARRADGTFLWHTLGHQSNLSKEGGVAGTVCLLSGSCSGMGNPLLTTADQLFVKKDRDYDLIHMSRRQYEQVFRAAVVEFDSIVGTRSPDLHEFQLSGGKMLTYHGLADEIIPFRGSRQYYDAVTMIHPDVHEFYRLFESPGLGHCGGGAGGFPARSFEALVEWVEKGIPPDALEAIDAANRTSLLCPYPQSAVFVGIGPEYSKDDFVCKRRGG